MQSLVTVRMETSDVKRALRQLGAKAPQAMMRAVNRTAATVRTQAVRAIAKEIKLRQKEIRGMVPLVRATVRVLEAQVIARGRPISLMRLGARQTKLGVTYKGPMGRILIRHAFIATMPGRKRPSVWKRAGKARLPILKQVGASVPNVVIQKRIFESMQSNAEQLLAKNMAQQTDYLLSRRRA